MEKLVLVAVGGAVGSIARYSIQQAVNGLWPTAFPLATWLINLVGSFAIGVCAAWVQQEPVFLSKTIIQPLLMAGLCGGFTTFSAFSLETVNLLKQGNPLIAGGYVMASLLGCFLATSLGYGLVKG